MKGIKKPKDESEGGSGRKMMGRWLRRTGQRFFRQEEVSAGGKNDNVEQERINKIKVHKENSE